MPREDAAVQRDARVTAISTANRGLGAARNRGLAEARGEFVNVLDADDRLHPEKIARQAAVLIDTHDVGVVLCDVDFIDDGLKMGVTWLPKGRTEILHAQRTGEEFRGDQSRAVVAGGSIAFTQRGKIRVCHRTPEES